MQPPLHKKVRAALEARIVSGDLGAGDRLPAERALQDDFGVARSVVRQALAGLSRDGLVVSAYPRGYTVLGPRIPWISRLRLLRDEPWSVLITDVKEAVASERVAAALDVPIGSPVAERHSELRGRVTGDPWGLGLSSYPLSLAHDAGRAILLGQREIDYDDLERAFDRRIIGYHERIRARLPTPTEQSRLHIARHAPVIEMARISRTTTIPISYFVFIGCADCFEGDYLVQP
jgi:GntR family transcriptional regulator